MDKDSTIGVLSDALRRIALDDGGFLAADPSRWPSYIAISALYYDGQPMTQDQYREGMARLKAEYDIT